MSKKFIAAIIVSAFLFSILAETLVVNAQKYSTVQTMEPLLNVNLVYAYAQGNSASVVLNVTRLADFGANSSTTLVDVYRIHLFSNGVLICSEGLGFFSNTNLPMTSSNGNSIMGTVIAIPATHSGMAALPNKVGQSSLESYDVTLEDSIGTFSSPPSGEGSWLTVEWMYSETFNQTLDQTYTPPNGIVAQVNLEHFNGGYLYNILVPQDQLSQINLLNPLNDLHLALAAGTSPSPAASPFPSAAPTETATVSAAPTASPSPTIPEFSSFEILPLLVAATAFSFAYKRRKGK